MGVDSSSGWARSSRCTSSNEPIFATETDEAVEAIEREEANDQLLQFNLSLLFSLSTLGAFAAAMIAPNQSGRTNLRATAKEEICVRGVLWIKRRSVTAARQHTSLWDALNGFATRLEEVMEKLTRSPWRQHRLIAPWRNWLF